MNILNDIILILKNFKAYRYWNQKRKGKKFCEYDRGAGYYMDLSAATSFITGKNPIGTKWETKMKSGKTGIYELVSYKNFGDPNDMIEYSLWNLIGYKGEKEIKDCTFKEFLSLYNRKTHER